MPGLIMLLAHAFWDLDVHHPDLVSTLGSFLLVHPQHGGVLISLYLQEPDGGARWERLMHPGD